MENSNIKPRIIPMTGMRKIIANQMKHSLTVNAQLSHSIIVDMSEVILQKQKYKSKGVKISFNDIILAATIKALRKFPILNSEVIAEGILVKDYINIGIAVSLDEGLIVPNIKNAQNLNLIEIARKSVDLTSRARTGMLQQDEYRNGTFTVSNLGMLGLDNFQAIINPPESGILAVGKITDTPVVKDKNICIRSMMNLTLSYDHRVVDGDPAARFLLTIKQFLENPEPIFYGKES